MCYFFEEYKTFYLLLNNEKIMNLHDCGMSPSETVEVSALLLKTKNLL